MYAHGASYFPRVAALGPLLPLLLALIVSGVQSTSTWKTLTLPLQVGDADALVQWGEAAVVIEKPSLIAAPAFLAAEEQGGPKTKRRKTLKKNIAAGKKHGKRRRGKKHRKRHGKRKNQHGKVGLARTATATARVHHTQAQSQQAKTLTEAIVSATQAAVEEATARAARAHTAHKAGVQAATSAAKPAPPSLKKKNTTTHTALTAARTGTRQLLPWKQWVAAAGGAGDVPGEIVQDEQKIQDLETTNDRLAVNYKTLDKEFKKSEYSQEEINERFDRDQAHIGQQQSLLQAGFQEISKEEGNYKALAAKAQDQDRQLIAEDRRMDKVQQVVELKAKTEGMLRGQLQQLKQQLGDDQTREAVMDRRVEQELRNSTKMLKGSKTTGHAVAKEFRKLQFRLNATAMDKEQLRAQREKLLEENQRLTLQGTRSESLRREQQAERDALQHELENGQQERNDLQHELDILEANGTTAAAVEKGQEEPRKSAAVEAGSSATVAAVTTAKKAPQTVKVAVAEKKAGSGEKDSGVSAKPSQKEAAAQDSEEDAEVDAALEAADDVTETAVSENPLRSSPGPAEKHVVVALQGSTQDGKKEAPLRKEQVAMEDLDY